MQVFTQNMDDKRIICFSILIGSGGDASARCSKTKFYIPAPCAVFWGCSAFLLTFYLSYLIGLLPLSFAFPQTVFCIKTGLICEAACYITSLQNLRNSQARHLFRFGVGSGMVSVCNMRCMASSVVSSFSRNFTVNCTFSGRLFGMK